MLVSVFLFKQKTAYEMRISDWSSDVGSSDLVLEVHRNLDPCIGQELLRVRTDLPRRRPPSEGTHPRRPLHGVDSADELLALACDADEIGRASCRTRVCQSV